MNIDGVNTLACLCRIDKDTTKTSKVYPLPHSKCLSQLTRSRRMDLADSQCTLSKTLFPILLSSSA